MRGRFSWASGGPWGGGGVAHERLSEGRPACRSTWALKARIAARAMVPRRLRCRARGMRVSRSRPRRRNLKTRLGAYGEQVRAANLPKSGPPPHEASIHIHSKRPQSWPPASSQDQPVASTGGRPTGGDPSPTTANLGHDLRRPAPMRRIGAQPLPIPPPPSPLPPLPPSPMSFDWKAEKTGLKERREFATLRNAARRPSSMQSSKSNGNIDASTNRRYKKPK